MKALVVSLVIVIAGILSSCSDFDPKMEFAACFDQKMQKLEAFTEFEQVLLDEGFLTERTKEGYRALVDTVLQAPQPMLPVTLKLPQTTLDVLHEKYKNFFEYCDCFSSSYEQAEGFEDEAALLDKMRVELERPGLPRGWLNSLSDEQFDDILFRIPLLLQIRWAIV